MKPFECGSIPEEVHSHLVNNCCAATFLMVCKGCGKTLISIKEEHGTRDDGKPNFYTKTAYFRCECGRKFKKLAMDLENGGYKCQQASVEKNEVTTYVKKRRVVVKEYTLRAYYPGGKLVSYKVTSDAIEGRMINAREATGDGC